MKIVDIRLTGLAGGYGIRGSSVYTKALVSANPASWLDLYGQFLYSQPDTTTLVREQASGNLVLQNQLLFYSGQQYLVSASSKLPHPAGSAGAEIRPFRRLRIVESWLTDRLHTSGSAVQTLTLTASTFSSPSGRRAS